MESPFRHYILNSSFHGFRYLVERGSHWSEKIFWLVCCILSWGASALLMHATWGDFQNNAISFVVETSYLDWNTNFPSVSVCEIDNQERIAQITDSLFGDPHDYNLDEIVKELVFFRGLSFYTLQMCGPQSPPSENCFITNHTFLNGKVRSKCQQTFRTCMWNDEEFDCCEYFVDIDTELGTCYGINSRQGRIANNPKYEMVSNKYNGPGTLYMEMYGYQNVYILGEQDVPSLTTLKSDILPVSPHIHYHRFMVLREIENQSEVKEVTIKQRKCRFMNEVYFDVHRYYSYSTCGVQCRKDAQIRICNCTHHLMPNTESSLICNMEGLACLNTNYQSLAVQKASWANRTGLVCDCIPSCTEIELSVIKDDRIGIQEEFAIVELSLDRLPTERFERNVVRGKLDLVVSMGGTTALFLGASILSFVEVVYYFTLRPLSNSFKTRAKSGQNGSKPLPFVR